MSSATTLADALAPLREDPKHAAILLDVDGTLAPIVRNADDAQVPEATRQMLIPIARRYGLVACVTGRRAAEARRMVSLGIINYVGTHGTELLRAGSTEPELDPQVEDWMRRVQAFGHEAHSTELRRLRVRLEDKGAIVAFHWRGVPDETAARAAIDAVASRAEAAGLRTHWGRKVLEVRPPVRMDKGTGIRTLLDSSEVDVALYAGDDATDLDAFRALRELTAEGRLRQSILVGVRSEEGPTEITDEADLVVTGPDGVRALLGALSAG